GLVDAYVNGLLIDAAFAGRLRASAWRFGLFYGLGAVPWAGRFVRRLWGRADFRRHVGRGLREGAYLGRCGRAAAAAGLIRWLHAGRVGPERARRLAERPARYWAERLTLGLLPLPKLHRALAEPAWVRERFRAGLAFARAFFRDAAFRERWFLDEVEDGFRQGMLTVAERDTILGQVRDPFIVKYLKCLGVHFLTLPVTQIISLLTAVAVASWTLVEGGTWGEAGMRLVLILALFQVLPVSPGSFCRGAFVVYLMLRERVFRDYMIAAPLSFVKYIGYLAFPFQMVAMYPELARFMGARWATGLVHHVPVFGERGALLEHGVFHLCFNVPRIFGRWARPRIKGLLDLWLLAGLLILIAVFGGCGVLWTSTAGINVQLAVLALFVLPRVLFYPLLKKK
ncbi:MAG: hypothetical protein JW951_05240, partial [Lentisphaerae bacterium]|nr:hypothetical protein [Lentisphaerota bacterium]